MRFGKRFVDISNPDLKGVYVIVDEETGERLSSVEMLIDKLNEFDEAEERLYDYFFKWFEEERGVYREDFNILWASIKEGEHDD